MFYRIASHKRRTPEECNVLTAQDHITPNRVSRRIRLDTINIQLLRSWNPWESGSCEQVAIASMKINRWRCRPWAVRA
jgi:D-hexose-6-phosphate mutarotase